MKLSPNKPPKPKIKASKLVPSSGRNMLLPKSKKNKADERIATLQGELGAEDSINRDFESKKASLEKEKEKKRERT